MNYLATGKVAEPILSLYAFQLKYNLAQGTKEPVADANNIWIQIQEIIESVGITELDNLPNLIQENEIKNQSNQDRRLTENDLFYQKKYNQQYNNLDFRIGIDPLIIHDTYVANLTFAYPLPEVKLSDLKGLNPQNYLIPENINPSLGQTLVFFAQPLEKLDNEQSLQEFADACVEALFTEKKVTELKIKCQNKGKLLGSHIFEYNNDANSPQQQCHILIWLNTNPQITNLEKLQQCYYPLIELLLCRSKIIYVRNQAIWCNQQARKVYRELENQVNEFNLTPNQQLHLCLDKFQQWLKSAPDKSFKYAHNIRDLQIHRTAIRTNIKNYKLHLEKIEQLGLGDDLQLLSDFLKLAQNTYVQQITTDLAYLIPGQKLFEHMVDTIRGVVEIEEAKQDKSLQNTVQVLGVALGGGAIVSGVVSQYIEKPVTLPTDVNYQIQPIIISFTWSFLATVFFGLVAFLWTKLGRKSS